MWKMRGRRSRGGRRRFPLAVMGLVQFVLLIAAQIDLLRRPASAVRGPKWAWRTATLINFIGPIAYFALGRREREGPSPPVAISPAEAA